MPRLPRIVLAGLLLASCVEPTPDFGKPKTTQTSNDSTTTGTTTDAGSSTSSSSTGGPTSGKPVAPCSDGVDPGEACDDVAAGRAGDCVDSCAAPIVR